MSRKILNGWKEISNHIERGLRTAQRWEGLGMPVHRPAAKDRTAVVAFADELDRWIVRGGSIEQQDLLARVRQNISNLAWYTTELATQTRSLQKQIRRSIEISRRSHPAIIVDPALAVPANRAAMLPFRLKDDAKQF